LDENKPNPYSKAQIAGKNEFSRPSRATQNAAVTTTPTATLGANCPTTAAIRRRLCGSDSRRYRTATLAPEIDAATAATTTQYKIYTRDPAEPMTNG